jgi:hypothetical protein
VPDAKFGRLILALKAANRPCWSQKARRPLEQPFEFRRARAFGKRGKRCRDQIPISGIKRQRVTFTGDRAELGRGLLDFLFLDGDHSLAGVSLVY